MKIPMIIYRGENKKKNNSWIRYLLRNIRQNKNNLVVVTGKTGSGKTWSTIAICEMLSKENKVYFGIDHIVFGLKPLMKLINSGTLKKGSSIIFDEPQVSISAREWQSKANRIFNYLLSTFRHKNLNLFFCTPYEDLLDKSSRKLFHAKFETVSINKRKKIVKLKPKIMQYNAHFQKFYEAYLKICYKPEGMSSYSVKKLTSWEVPKPSEDLIKEYEQKKLRFTNVLNIDIEKELRGIKKEKEKRNELKEKIVSLVEEMGVKKAAEICKKEERTIYRWLKEAREENGDERTQNKANVLI